MKECQDIEWKETWSDEYLKWICGFANAQGGKLYIGVNDSETVVGVANAKKLLEDIPNKIVTTLGIVAEVNLLSKGGKEYLEIVVPPSNIPIAYHGVYHYRSGSTKQELKGAALQQFLFRKMGLSWDDVVQERATLNMISPEAIDYFQRNAIRNKRMAESAYTPDVRTVLENLNLLDEDGHIKNAALLVFGKNPAKYFPLCDFRIGRFGAGEADLMFQDVISGDLIRMADRVVEVLKSKYLISPIHYEGLQRIEPLEIPEDALREAIFNAIIHKDYTGVHIQMKVYNDRVELWDEGSLPAGWTIEDLLRKHNSKPRNRNIAEIFYRAGFIESWGRGIDKIISGMEGSGLPMPKFEYDCGGIRVTFYRNTRVPQDVSQDVPQDVPQELSEIQRLIFNSIRANPKISRAEIAKRCGVSTKTIGRHLADMKQYVHFVGSGYSGHWEIANSSEQNGCRENRTTDSAAMRD